jgi:UDP:flavonoid glycosyltransferase YjiC (YdhE family)
MQGSAVSPDALLVGLLRRALDEVLADPRFQERKSGSAIELAEHILARAAAGERDIERLKASAFERLGN